MGKQLFPNLSSKIVTLSGHSYTATKDCFLMGVPFVSGGDIGTFINDNVALRAQQNCCVFLKAGDRVTAGLSNQSYTWETTQSYYNNSLAVFNVLER